MTFAPLYLSPPKNTLSLSPESGSVIVMFISGKRSSPYEESSSTISYVVYLNLVDNLSDQSLYKVKEALSISGSL